VCPWASAPLIGNCGYTQEMAEKAVVEGHADLIAFGRPFISNLDLVERFKHGWPMAPLAPMTDWYLPTGEKGYTDFRPTPPSSGRERACHPLNPCHFRLEAEFGEHAHPASDEKQSGDRMPRLPTSAWNVSTQRKLAWNWTTSAWIG